MSERRADGLAGACIPDLRGVAVGCQDRFAIGTERNLFAPALQPNRRRDRRAADRVPDSRRFVRADSCHASAIGAEHRLLDGAVVLQHHGGGFAARHVPDACGFVPARRHDALAIR